MEVKLIKEVLILCTSWPESTGSIKRSSFCFSDPFYRPLLITATPAVTPPRVWWVSQAPQLCPADFSITVIIWIDRSNNKVIWAINPAVHQHTSDPDLRWQGWMNQVLLTPVNTNARLTSSAWQGGFGPGQGQQPALLQVQSGEVAGDSWGPHTLLPHQIRIFV